MWHRQWHLYCIFMSKLIFFNIEYIVIPAMLASITFYTPNFNRNIFIFRIFWRWYIHLFQRRLFIFGQWFCDVFFTLFEIFSIYSTIFENCIFQLFLTWNNEIIFFYQNLQFSTKVEKFYSLYGTMSFQKNLSLHMLWSWNQTILDLPHFLLYKLISRTNSYRKRL